MADIQYRASGDSFIDRTLVIRFEDMVQRVRNPVTEVLSDHRRTYRPVMVSAVLQHIRSVGRNALR